MLTKTIDGMNRSNYALDSTSDGGMAKKHPSEVVRHMVGIRLTDEDAKRLDDLAASVPVATKHAIARAALMIGVGFLEEHPERLVRGDARKRTPPKRGARRR